MNAPGGYFSVSPGQRQLWFLHQLDPSSGAYNIGTALRVSGELDAGAMEEAFGALIARHVSLRSVFTDRDGSPCCRVLAQARSTMAVDDLQALRDNERTDAAARLSRQETTTPFDLSVAPLMRLRLIRLGAGESLLLLTVHHIVADGRSMHVLLRDLFEAYRICSAGGTPGWETAAPPVDTAPPPAGDDDDDARDLEYWRETLRDLPGALDLPFDLARPLRPTFKGTRASAYLSQEAAAGLRDLARKEQATLFCVLLAGWQTLLSRWTRQSDIPVGTPVSLCPEGREDVVGMMVNTVVLRGDLSSSPSFAKLVRATRDRVFDALDHKALPFDTLVEALAPHRERGRNPLFQSMLTLGSAPNAAVWAPGTEPTLAITAAEPAYETTKFDLSLGVTEERDGRLRLRINAATDLFVPATAERAVSHLRTLLESALDDPAAPVSLLALVHSDDPASTGARSGDDTEYPYVTPTHLMTERAVAAPDDVAVSDSTRSLTYCEFAARVNQLSHRLRRAGVGVDTVVGVCLPRSVDLLVAVHAVAAAGGAYLPLDPELPTRRLGTMARDSQAHMIVTWSGWGRGDSTFDGVPLLTMDLERARLDAEPDTPLGVTPPPDALAYVIFTSGSTGTPKGVGVSYKSLVNRLGWMQQFFPLSARDRVLHKTPFGFDVSVWELFWPLSVGARVIVAAPDGHRDPGCLAVLMRREAVTVAHFVPSVLDVFLDEVRSPGDLPALRLIFASGEELGGDVAARTLDVLPRARLHNLYGPTEAAVDVTWQPVLRADKKTRVPIGSPVPNTRIEVLSAELRRCAAGVPGELCLAGVQLARGYVSRPGLTAERFVPDPFGPPGGRLYRTGDLGRLRDDGSLEYLGRLDTQTKINGLRIELGEIEAGLAAQPEVRAAVVTVVNDRAGKRLVAYLVPAEPAGEQECASKDWAGRLRERLPPYMIPAQYVMMPELPLSRNGKLDRTALPVPARPGPVAAGGPTAPGAETTVATVWGELLGIAHVGPEDDFFSIGGDSMRSLRVVSRLRATGYVLTLEDLYTHSTPRTLARLLEEPGRASSAVPRIDRGAGTGAQDAPAHGAFQLLGAEDRARLEAMGVSREDAR